MADFGRLGKLILPLCGILLLIPQRVYTQSDQHPVIFQENPWESNSQLSQYPQQRSPQWHQFPAPRKRLSQQINQQYYRHDIPNSLPYENIYQQENRRNYDNYNARSSYDLINSETRVPNDGRLLSDSAFTRISETLGAINTVGHYLVDMVSDNDSSEEDQTLKKLPNALYTISKNVLGPNVTNKIAPIVKKALPKVLPDAPITRITTDLDRKDEKFCTTPEGDDGFCEDLSNCPQLLLNLINLRESLCFKDLFVPGVCCPKDSIVISTPGETSVVATTKSPTFLVPVTTQRPKPATTKNPTAILVLTTKRPKPSATTKRPTTTHVLTSPKPLGTTSFYTVPPPAITNFSNIVDLNECGQREDEGGRIVGGTEAKSGDWPWMAAIYLLGSKRREFWCGGTLVGKKHVLTAAHCTRDSKQIPFPARQFIVRLGDVDLARDDEPSRPVTYRVTAVRAHDQFSRVGYYNDIAVLVLADNVQKSKYVIPICLPSGELLRQHFEGSLATVVGWGTTRYGGTESSRQLEAKLPVWRNEDCDRAYFQPITETFLCAGYARGGVDACQGDSGGPLMLLANGRWTQIGVVSFGNKCGEPGYPGVYTRITHYNGWLHQNLV